MAVSLDDLVRSWLVDLRARNLSENTVRIYSAAMRSLRGALPDHCLQDAAAITRKDLSTYLARLNQTHAPGGVSAYYRAQQQFFKWADEVEEEITPNPMAKMKPPVVPEQETRVLRESEIKALLKACEGREFIARRDMAMVALLLDTGIRRAELAGLTTADVSVDHREIGVLGKGRRARIVPFGRQAARALDRYERVRKQHRWADSDGYWLAERGREMTAEGVDQAVRRRGVQAGIPDLHPHMLRHTWAHAARSEQSHLHDDEIMRLAGWKSRQMLTRYAASTADERAREKAKGAAFLDRL